VGWVTGEVVGQVCVRAGFCKKKSLNCRRAAWNSSRVVRVSRREFLLVVMVWMMLWENMIALMAAVAVG